MKIGGKCPSSAEPNHNLAFFFVLQTVQNPKMLNQLTQQILTFEEQQHFPFCL